MGIRSVMAQATRLMAWAEQWIGKLDGALEDDVIETSVVFDPGTIKLDEDGTITATVCMGTEVGTGIRTHVKIKTPFKFTPTETGRSFKIPGVEIHQSTDGSIEISRI